VIGPTPARRYTALRPYLGGTLARTYTDRPHLHRELAPHLACSACRIILRVKAIRASGVMSLARSGPSRSFVPCFPEKVEAESLFRPFGLEIDTFMDEPRRYILVATLRPDT